MSEVYIITNKVNGKRYAGQGAIYENTPKWSGGDKRWREHKGRAKRPPFQQPLHEAIAEFGEDNFTLEVLFQCNKQHADEYERKAIAMYDTIVPRGYNVQSGGAMTSEQARSIGIRSQHDLPMYIRPFGVGNNRGYSIRGPSIPFRAYTSMLLTMEEKLDKAKAYLKACVEGQHPEMSKNDMKLPKYVQHVRQRNALQVQIKKEGKAIATRLFSRGTTDEQLVHAQACIDEFRKQGLIV